MIKFKDKTIQHWKTTINYQYINIKCKVKNYTCSLSVSGIPTFVKTSNFT